MARTPGAGASRYALVTLLAAVMGIQNAAARKLAVPDLTTTVLTLTITGIAADSVVAGGGGSAAGRRVIAVVAMLGGALVGAILVIHRQLDGPLVIALVAISAVACTSGWLARSDPAWGCRRAADEGSHHAKFQCPCRAPARLGGIERAAELAPVAQRRPAGMMGWWREQVPRGARGRVTRRGRSRLPRPPARRPG